MRELPRQLSADQLEGLFNGRSMLTDMLCELYEPLGIAAEREVADLEEGEKIKILAAHPRIGAADLHGRSAAEQGDDNEPWVLEELAKLNEEYEHRFGFRFVVFVNGRRRREILPIFRERLGRTREEELETGMQELIEIARGRWTGTT